MVFWAKCFQVKQNPKLWMFCLFFLMNAIAGCSTNNQLNQSGENNTNIVTPSDETDNRRRARIRLELAENYFAVDQNAVALDEIKQALAADPAFSDAYNLRGLVYLKLNDFGQADDNFKRAMGLRPGDPNLFHNYGWLLCQQKNFAQADQYFSKALEVRAYTARPRTLMVQGLCQKAAGHMAEAEQTLFKAYELDAGNPVVAYHISSLLYQRKDFERARFYIRRINNGDYATSDSLWLGIKVENALNDSVSTKQLGDQLRKRFPDSKELNLYQQGAFNE